MELDLAYLQTEMAWIDLLLQGEFWRRKHARRNPAETLQGLDVLELEAQAWLARPFGPNSGHLTTLQPTAQEFLTDTYQKLIASAEPLRRQGRVTCGECAKRLAIFTVRGGISRSAYSGYQSWAGRFGVELGCTLGTGQHKQ